MSGELPTVTGDGHLIELVFHTLLENALTFRRPDTAPVVTVGSAYCQNVQNIVVSTRLTCQLPPGTGLLVAPDVGDRQFGGDAVDQYDRSAAVDQVAIVVEAAVDLGQPRRNPRRVRVNGIAQQQRRVEAGVRAELFRPPLPRTFVDALLD